MDTDAGTAAAKGTERLKLLDCFSFIVIDSGFKMQNCQLPAVYHLGQVASSEAKRNELKPCELREPFELGGFGHNHGRNCSMGF